ncbi:MAG TPA: MBOAT family protein [Planctomycetaceae bacterium]
MLFNSFVFIFAFLPITLIGFALLATSGRRRAGLFWLVLCSLFYYGYWNWHYLLLLLFSMGVNYLIGTLWLQIPTRPMRKPGLILGLVFNLSVLGYFKYTNLLISTFDALTSRGFPLRSIILPLGISFFTFQKIAYLVDVYRGHGYSRNFLDYSLFVVFFPQLIAGPIVHPREVLPQFSRRKMFGISAKNLSVGLTLFFFGLAKKVLIADSLAPTASSVFDGVAAGQTPGLTRAWLGALVYALQIYFDFSGYTDMAIGLARLFGVRLPINFDSPYKAQSIVDFWRRWHITLSRFLRDYLYIPLGGNRNGKLRRYLNLMITMLLGGLWHGANWTFILWGTYHGILLIGHRFLGRRWDDLPRSFRQPAFFLLVVIGWVLFRAESLAVAGHVLTSMFVPTAGILIEKWEAFAFVTALAAAWSMAGPNAFDWHGEFRLNLRTANVLAVVLGACFAIMMGGRDSPFLYFQF